MLSLPIAFSSVIGIFAPGFSRPVWQHAKVLITGAILAPGQRTVLHSAPFFAVRKQFWQNLLK